jgi:pyruvate/2-oxoglutarate dehydrogenase complex dihydrolipoamide acyltransferase (E2) component
MPALPIRMPQLGEAAARAVVKAWLVAPGESVRTDQDLVEVETEKSVLTVTAPADGVLIDQVAQPGANQGVGEVLGHLDVAADCPQLDGTPASGDDDMPAPAAAPAPTSRVTEAIQRRRTDTETADGLPVPVRATGLGYVSPRLRARMHEVGLRQDDLSSVRGTGMAGRVSVKDLERFLDEVDRQRTVEASPMRIAVADSMRRSWNRPLATIAMQLRLDALLAHRKTLPGRPSATIYGARALALALRRDDHAACRLVGRRLTRPASLDIAVAIEFNNGVVTPVLRRVDEGGLEQVNEAYDKVLEHARAGRIPDQHLGGSIASVSNYGTFGITWATPIPLPDQSVILGIGEMRNVPDWEPATKSWGRIRACELTLTFDHRVTDGGGAGNLLKHIVELLEKPERLV